MMKKLFKFVLVLLFTCTCFLSRADEGMWLLNLIERLNYTDMQKMGLKLTPEEIYSVNNSSLKDAIVQFAGGCTGEMISAEGLLITNHHCGFGAIQSNSTVDNDYLTNGFWAKSKDQELKCEGLTVKFLVRMEDVTQRVMAQITSDMDETQRNNKIAELANQIKEEATLNTTYDAEVKPFFNGNEFYLFVYEIFKDVRFVGAPPYSLGKFGGDTDNWMWPRHTCDFAMFRVYTAPDGKPAEYSAENVPMKPKHFLPISIKGIQNGDFTMILGYPGSTDRFLTSYGVKMAIEKYNPSIVKVREKKLEILKEDMKSSDAIRLKYASKYAGTSNYWKYFIGQTKSLKQLKIYDKKVEIENDFKEWIAQNDNRKNEYGNALNDISSAYVEIEKYIVPRLYFSEALSRGAEVYSYAYSFKNLSNLLKAEKKDKAEIDKVISQLKINAEKFFKDYNANTDKKLLAAMLTIYNNNVANELKAEEVKNIASKYGNDFEKYADKLFEKSIFVSLDRVNNFLNNPNYKALKKDMAFSSAINLYSYAIELGNKTDAAYLLLEKGNRKFVKGVMEMQPDKKFFPNANMTMRMTYGQVKDYYPADAVHYDFATTLEGVIQKEDADNPEFNVPARLIDLYNRKNFGIWGNDSTLNTCFITTNDITGGNSGSPVLNAEGHLIGLAFDGNWEAMSDKIAYNPDLQRCINVDIRYVLFIIDKFAGADNIINELKIISDNRPRKRKSSSIDDASGLKPQIRPNVNTNEKLQQNQLQIVPMK